MVHEWFKRLNQAGLDSHFKPPGLYRDIPVGETGDGLALDGEGAKGTMKDAGTLQVGSSSHWDE